MWDFDRARHAVDGSSHMCSVADVMLGAFRYCVNEPNNREAGKAMFPVGMMWKREHKGKIYVNDCGLVYRPANVKAEMHQAEYGAGELRIVPNSLLHRLPGLHAAQRPQICILAVAAPVEQKRSPDQGSVISRLRFRRPNCTRRTTT